MRTQLMLLGSIGCMCVASATQAQTTPAGLSNDFAVTETVIELPAELTQAAGYPQWRLVTMNGRQAVPYNYCTWLIDQKPWLTEVFSPGDQSPVGNCAAGISAVTKQQVDDTLPLEAGTAAFWRTRPVGYQYMVPDHDLTQAQWLELMSEPDGEYFGFVTDPRSLSEYLATQVERIQALEDWRQSLAQAGGVVTQDALEAWAQTQGFVRAEDLPEVELMTREEIESLVSSTAQELRKEQADFVSQADLPEGSLLTQEQAEKQFVLQSDLPDGALLTEAAADGRYQVKGVGGTNYPFLFSLWWWVLMIALGLSLIGLVLWALVNRKANQSKELAVKAMNKATTAMQLGLPAGWEPVGDLPTQADLDALSEGESVTVRFVHDDETKEAVEFTSLQDAFPQNTGKRRKGLLVSGDATSTKPVACRVGMMVRECRKALEAHDKEGGIQPRDPKTGQFAKTAA